MQHSKLTGLLRTLEPKELSGFYKHLKQVYEPEHIPLKVFEYVKKFHPEYRDDKRLDPEYAYPRIFEDEIHANPGNRTKLLNALSDLHLALKNFLLSEKATRPGFESQYLWAMILQERGMDAEFVRSVEDLEDGLRQKQPEGTVLFLKRMASSYFFYFHSALAKPKSRKAHLKLSSNNLDQFYDLFQLKLACEKANLNNILAKGSGFNESITDSEILARALLSDHPLVQLFREAYLLITGKQDGQFNRLEAMLNQHASETDVQELQLIFSYLHNIASIKIREGQLEYWEKAHRLNQFGLKENLYQTGGMGATQFCNIVQSACRMKDFDWAAEFISGQDFCLQPPIRKDAVLLAQAIVAFEQKAFEVVLKKLHACQITELPHAIRSRMMELMSNYELREKEQFMLGLCESFSTYLRRKQKSHGSAIPAALKFVEVLKKMVRRVETRQKIQAEIESAPFIAARAWLLEKAAQYQPKD